MKLDWHVDPLGLALLLLIGWVYFRGGRALGATGASHHHRRRYTVLFWSGWVALAIAFGPPIHALSEASFAAHMVQHEILMLAAAPLLVLSRPQGVLMWGLPPVLARAAAAVTRSPRMRGLFALLVGPVAAWLLHLVVLWGWHVPAAFDAAVTSEAMHWLQHISFFIAAVIFWHSIFAPGIRGRHSAPAVISLFATGMHTGLLGVLLTFSASAWYSVYDGGVAGLTALEDQQLGGLIMWVPGGGVFVIAALALIARWLSRPDRETLTRRPAA